MVSNGVNYQFDDGTIKHRQQRTRHRFAPGLPSQREEAQRLHCQQSSVARLCEKYQRIGKSMFRCKNLSKFA